MVKGFHAGKGVASALVLSLVLVACGGGGGSDDSAPAATPSSSAPSSASSSSTPAASSSSSSDASSSEASSSEASSSSESSSSESSSSSSAPATGQTWGFNPTASASVLADPVPSTSGTVNAKNLGATATSADGLSIFHNATSALRFRTTVAEEVTSYQWNYNGSSFTNNTTLLTAVGASAPTNIRSYIGVPVTSGQAFTLEVTYRQTGSPTAGKIALISNSGIVLHAVDAFANTEPATLSFTQAAGHSLSEVRILYSRENTTTGGLDLNGIVLQ